MVIALVLLIGLAAVLVQLERTHCRATGPRPSLRGSCDVDDADLARVRADLAAIGPPLAARADLDASGAGCGTPRIKIAES